jgi:Transposase, Mutator family
VAGPDRMTTEEVVRKVLLDEHADVLRESLKLLVRELMEIEVSELIGAELGERRPGDRATHRNGYRQRRWDTRAGEIELQIPKRQQSVAALLVHPACIAVDFSLCALRGVQQFLGPRDESIRSSDRWARRADRPEARRIDRSGPRVVVVCRAAPARGARRSARARP